VRLQIISGEGCWITVATILQRFSSGKANLRRAINHSAATRGLSPPAEVWLFASRQTRCALTVRCVYGMLGKLHPGPHHHETQFVSTRRGLKPRTESIRTGLSPSAWLKPLVLSDRDTMVGPKLEPFCQLLCGVRSPSGRKPCRSKSRPSLWPTQGGNRHEIDPAHYAHRNEVVSQVVKAEIRHTGFAPYHFQALAE
jgi:hypothetical protein